MDDNKDYRIEDTSNLMTASKPKKSSGAMLIAGVVAVALILAVAVGVVIAKVVNGRESEQIATSIADEDTQTDADTSGMEDNADKDDSESVNNNLDEVYAAYADILEDYEYDIRGYDWQEGSRNRCVAITDLNGDGTPELLFFSTDSEYSGVLRVFTYMNGSAFECDYDNSLIYDEYDSNIPADGLFEDVQVAAGTRYVIYTGKNAGTLYIAYTMGDESTFYHSIRYEMKGDDYISAVREVWNKYGPNEDYTGEVDEYYVNGGRVSNNSGMEEFKAARNDFGRLLMFSGYMDDMKVFEYTKNTSPMAMSYDEAMSFLR